MHPHDWRTIDEDFQRFLGYTGLGRLCTQEEIDRLRLAYTHGNSRGRGIVPFAAEKKTPPPSGWRVNFEQDANGYWVVTENGSGFGERRGPYVTEDEVLFAVLTERSRIRLVLGDRALVNDD